MGEKSESRRSFLKKSAAAAAGSVAAPYVITSTALGNASVPPASERITLGHIGVGGQGSGLLTHALGLKDAQCVATCDPVLERREGAAKQIESRYTQDRARGTYQGCDTYNDFRDLLARDDIDAVVVATVAHWHVPVAIAAARAGKDMYVEKPLGLCIAWHKALREEIQRRGRVFQYGTMQRASRNFRFACELARNGYLGKLSEIHAWCAASGPGGSMTPIPIPKGFDYDMWLGPAPVTPYTADRCFTRGKSFVADNTLGFISEWGAHPLDIAQWGNGTDHTSPVEYEGVGKYPKDGLYDTAIEWDMRCRYANGVVLRFMSVPYATYGAAFGDEPAIDYAKPVIEKYRPYEGHGTTFVGSEGWVSVDRGGIYASDASLLSLTIAPDDLHLHTSNDHMQDFLNCIKSRSLPAAPIEAAIRSDTISHLCDIALRTGRKIVWDPEKEEIVGDEKANRYLTRPMRQPWRL